MKIPENSPPEVNKLRHTQGKPSGRQLLEQAEIMATQMGVKRDDKTMGAQGALLKNNPGTGRSSFRF
ncbi:MAG: hypothetical protein ACLQBD_00350 [Syntrophobacteraceae bacterium]